jgi:hypothetical protein
MKKLSIILLAFAVTLGFSALPAFAASGDSLPLKTAHNVKAQINFEKTITQESPYKTLNSTKALTVKSAKGGPKILVQPKTTYFKVPYGVKLKVRAASPKKCRYKWQYYDGGWYNVTGGTKATLKIPYTDKTYKNLKYRCVVSFKSNSKRKTVSKTVVLKMKSIPKAYIIVEGKGYGPGDTWKGTRGSKGTIHISRSSKNIYMKNVRIKYNASKINTALVITSVKKGYGYNIILSGKNTIETKGKNNMGVVLFSLDSRALHTFKIKGGTGASLKVEAGGGSLYVCQAALEIGTKTHVNAVLNKAVYNKDGFALNTCSLKVDKGASMQMTSGSKACMLNSGNTTVEKGATLNAKSTANAHAIACQMDGSLYIKGGTMNVSMEPSSGSKKSPNFIMEAIEFATDGTVNVENSGTRRGSLTTTIKTKYDGMTISGIVGGNMVVNKSDVKTIVSGSKIENADGYHLFGTMTVKNGANAEAYITGKDMLTGVSCNYDGLSEDDPPTGTINVINSNITAKVKGTSGEQTGIFTRQLNVNISAKQYKIYTRVNKGAAMAINLGMSEEETLYSNNYKPTGKMALSKADGILSPIDSTVNQYSYYNESLAEPYNSIETIYGNGNITNPATSVSIGVK